MSRKSFSQYFRLGKTQYELDFVDVPVNNGDIPLFIDPYAISRRTDRWSIQCNNLIVDFFEKAVLLVRSGKSDLAKTMFSNLKEPNQLRFGLSRGKSARGRGVSGKQAQDLYQAFVDSAAVRTGFLKNLQDCELLIDGIGRDKISDITANIIKEKLIEYTSDQCRLHNVKLDKVPSGYLWNNNEERWESKFVELPLCYKLPIILVPKAIARVDFEFSHERYYRHSILTYLQAEYLAANSALVRVLKDGRKKEPSKKSIIKEFPLTKANIYEFSKRHPEILERYKQTLAGSIAQTSNEQILDSGRRRQKPEYETFVKRLEQIPLGDDGAAAYHSLMIGTLEAVFFPYLINPRKEEGINQNRKRIDIVFENAAQEGFFYRLNKNKNIPCQYVMVECKNYTNDPKNPELDQICGRFSANRGQFGLLLCRNIKNKKLFYDRCKDAASDRKQFVIPLDDNDIKKMIQFKGCEQSEELDAFMDIMFRKLVM